MNDFFDDNTFNFPEGKGFSEEKLAEMDSLRAEDWKSKLSEKLSELLRVWDFHPEHAVSLLEDELGDVRFGDRDVLSQDKMSFANRAAACLATEPGQD